MCQSGGVNRPSAAGPGRGGPPRFARADGLDIGGDHRRVDAPRRAAIRVGMVVVPYAHSEPGRREAFQDLAVERALTFGVEGAGDIRARLDRGHRPLGRVHEHGVAVAVSHELGQHGRADSGTVSSGSTCTSSAPAVVQTPPFSQTAWSRAPAGRPASTRGRRTRSTTKSADLPVLSTTGTPAPSSLRRSSSSAAATVLETGLATGPSTSRRRPRGAVTPPSSGVAADGSA